MPSAAERDEAARPLQPVDDQPVDQPADHDAEQFERAHGRFCWPGKFRYLMMLVCVMCLTSLAANVVAFNQAILYMTGSKRVKSFPHYPYSITDQTCLHLAVAVGSACGTFIYSAGYTRYGARYIFGLTGFVSALTAALTPWAAGLGFWAFLVARFVQGFTYSADFAAVGVLITKWSPLNRSAMSVSILTSYSSLSSLLTFAVSGPVCQSPLGWPLMYYLCAGAGLLSFSLWMLLYRDHPAASPFIDQAELDVLKKDKLKEEIGKTGKVPYRKMLTNIVCWTIWVNAFAHLTASFFMYTFIGRFHFHVLKFSGETAGLMAALPSAPYIPLRICMGYINDKITFLSNKTKMNLFNSMCVTVPALFFVLVGLLEAEHRHWSVLCFVMIYICFAFSGGGFYKCANLTARQHTHFVIANIQFIKCLTLFIAPTLFKFTIKQNEEQLAYWRVAFWIIAGLLLGSGLMFNVFVSDQPQEFTKSGTDTKPAANGKPALEEFTKLKAVA